MFREFWLRQSRHLDECSLWTLTLTTLLWWMIVTMTFVQDIDRHDAGHQVGKASILGLIVMVAFGIWQTAGLRRRIRAAELLLNSTEQAHPRP